MMSRWQIFSLALVIGGCSQSAGDGGPGLPPGQGPGPVVTACSQFTIPAGRTGSVPWAPVENGWALPLRDLPAEAPILPADVGERGCSGLRCLYLTLWTGRYNGAYTTRGLGTGGHPGVDIPSVTGTVAYSIGECQVATREQVPWVADTSFAGAENHGWGGLVVLRCPAAVPDGYIWAIYGHSHRVCVNPGDTVRAGQPIALVGTTGNSTGPHLHFQIDRHVRLDTRIEMRGCGSTDPPCFPTYPPAAVGGTESRSSAVWLESFTHSPIQTVLDLRAGTRATPGCSNVGAASVSTQERDAFLWRWIPRLGCPRDTGGGVGVHNLHSVRIQDFYQPDPAWRYPGSDGATALIYTATLRTPLAVLIRSGFWGTYTCLSVDGQSNGGALLLGAPTEEEHTERIDAQCQPSRSGSNVTVQRFERGCMWYGPDAMSTTPRIHVHLAQHDARVDFRTTASCVGTPVIENPPGPAAGMRTIRVTAPNGGERLGVDARYDVRWTSGGNLPFVRVHLRENGTVVETLASRAPNGSAGGTIAFAPRPEHAGHRYTIGVSDSDDPSVWDESDGSFEVVSAAPTCVAPRTLCGATCVDTTADAANCGRCGNACATRPNASAACASGICRVLCGVGYADCDGNEANGCEAQLASSGAHCGRCGNACPSGSSCVAGGCMSTTTCVGGGRMLCGGACTDILSNTAHCGRCDNACVIAPNSVPLCSSGACRLSCNADYADCDGASTNGCETSLVSSAMHCGRCGNACPAGWACATGNCVPTCTGAGRMVCGGSCVDTMSDGNNCGSCDNRCGAGTMCRSGSCQMACPSGQTLCGTSCVDTRTSTAHCGVCNVACAMAQICQSGTCACPSGQTLCGGRCLDTQTDVFNCGACGNACPSGQNCAGGVCRTSGPVNDLPSSAMTLNLATPLVTITGTTAGATNNAMCHSGGDVFYLFTLTRREAVMVDTFGSTYDSTIAITNASGTILNSLCNDDACGTANAQVAAVLDAGTYLVAVGGFSGTGTFTLHLHHLPIGNGPAVQIIDTSVGVRTFTGTTSGAGTLSQSCGANGPGPENTYWFVTCPSFTRTSVTASVCGGATWDTVVEQRSSNRTDEVCVDDTSGCGVSSVTPTTVPEGAGLHTIYVDSYRTTDLGAYSLAVSFGNCTTGQNLCATGCRNLLTDAQNCGGCGVACAAGQRCTGGVCSSLSVCGDGRCDGTTGETCSSCAVDCGSCTTHCGDGTCNTGEGCASCPMDCGMCPSPSCGDGTCNSGETCDTCPGDCGTCFCMPSTGYTERFGPAYGPRTCAEDNRIRTSPALDVWVAGGGGCRVTVSAAPNRLTIQHNTETTIDRGTVTLRGVATPASVPLNVTISGRFSGGTRYRASSPPYLGSWVSVDRSGSAAAIGLGTAGAGSDVIIEFDGLGANGVVEFDWIGISSCR